MKKAVARASAWAAVGASTEALAKPKRQLICEVGVELVLEVEGRWSLGEFHIKRIQDARRLINGGGGEKGRIDIQNFRKRVIGFQSQSVA